ncbi:anti-sigma regulatory factor [Streptomyces tropicalis]|uniref:Anti-sigma regulatory factor n=1 Tax=Streptomyces tropicalis TaxID=3034234 RepID=A0ABT6AAH3_9ACTN|nr:anti-sigma regulatory factor [Streptomyces tropicalis]MDF3301458.1 anti-sigma regulatory factor [Streptomyces tropicalis]
MGAVSGTGTLVAEAGDVNWLRADVALAAAARRQAGQLARSICLDEERVARVELCVTEMATNLLKHAEDGAIALRVVRDRDRAGVECLAVDNGPGIDDVRGALRDGMSAAGSLGIGLGAIARLADAFGVHSVRGRGTAVQARFWTGDAPPDPGPVDVGGLTRPIGGEQVCGDTWAVRTATGDDPDVLLLLLCDGLGHGPLAARAADRAREAFRDSAHSRPAAVLEDVHRALRHTRGAAVAVARVDAAARRVELTGVGNTTALVAFDDRRTGLLSLPGIVGSQLPRLRTFEAAYPPGAALIMHSDGLSDRWAPADFPGLVTHGPALIAAQVLSQAAVRRDDAGIVVATHRRG